MIEVTFKEIFHPPQYFCYVSTNDLTLNNAFRLKSGLRKQRGYNEPGRAFDLDVGMTMSAQLFQPVSELSLVNLMECQNKVLCSHFLMSSTHCGCSL